MNDVSILAGTPTEQKSTSSGAGPSQNMVSKSKQAFISWCLDVSSSVVVLVLLAAWIYDLHQPTVRDIHIFISSATYEIFFIIHPSDTPIFLILTLRSPYSHIFFQSHLSKMDFASRLGSNVHILPAPCLISFAVPSAFVQ